jgi:hypothetical protein
VVNEGSKNDRKLVNFEIFKSFTKGESKMTQKGRAIQLQKSTVTDLMSHLAGLPEREKGPDDLVSLPEIFRTKEYMAEIQGALKKGYTFEDLAEIFTKRCGVSISARQLKYHYTRGKNRGVQSQSGKKVKDIGHQEERASPKSSSQKDTGKSAEIIVETAERSSKSPAIASSNRSTAKVKPGAFSIDMAPEEI